MVQETFEPGASVARVAQRHAINANQLFLWRKSYREGLLGCWEKTAIASLLPVSVSGAAVSSAARASGELPPSVSSGTIHVEIPKGYPGKHIMRVDALHRSTYVVRSKNSSVPW
jgi:transposase